MTQALSKGSHTVLKFQPKNMEMWDPLTILLYPPPQQRATIET